MANPSLVIIAGPNGAGKSTAAPILLKETFATPEFVNADVIAQGLSGFAPENSAFEAGRIMLRRLRQLARDRRSFAFETTLASRSFAPWIAKERGRGYQFILIFLWLSSADLAVQRVKERVRLGGHSVPEDIVRRRYASGLQNFFELYEPLADGWMIYDNSAYARPELIAERAVGQEVAVYERELWQTLQKSRP